MHPGSGSQRPVVRNNHLERNGTGLFFCWGVKYGLAEGNRIEDSRQYGISIGHRDTDNLIVNNTMRRSGKVGVLFRIDGDKPFAPHRNRLLQNRIEDSGPEDGVAVDIQGEVEELAIVGNEIVETRGSQRRIGIRVGAKARDIRLADNRIRGCAVEVADLRKRWDAAPRLYARWRRHSCLPRIIWVKNAQAERSLNEDAPGNGRESVSPLSSSAESTVGQANRGTSHLTVSDYEYTAMLKIVFVV